MGNYYLPMMSLAGQAEVQACLPQVRASQEFKKHAQNPCRLLTIPSEIRLGIITLVVQSSAIRIKRLSLGRRVDWKCHIASRIRDVCTQLRTETSMQLIKGAVHSVYVMNDKLYATPPVLAGVPDQMIQLIGYLTGREDGTNGLTERSPTWHNLIMCCIDVSDCKPTLRHVTSEAIADAILDTFEGCYYTIGSLVGRMPRCCQLRISASVEIPRVCFRATVDARTRELLCLTRTAVDDETGFHQESLTIAELSDLSGYDRVLRTNVEQEEKMKKQLEDEVALEEYSDTDDEEETDEEDYGTDEEDYETEDPESDEEVNEANGEAPEVFKKDCVEEMVAEEVLTT